MLKIWNCFDLINGICEFLHPIDELFVSSVNKILYSQIKIRFLKMETKLLPNDSSEIRRNRFPNVTQWVYSFFSSVITSARIWPKFIEIYNFPIVRFFSPKETDWDDERYSAECLRVSLQNQTWKMEEKLSLCRQCLRFDYSTKWVKVLLEEKVDVNSNYFSTSCLDLCFERIRINQVPVPRIVPFVKILN